MNNYHVRVIKPQFLESAWWIDCAAASLSAGPLLYVYTPALSPRSPHLTWSSLWHGIMLFGVWIQTAAKSDRVPKLSDLVCRTAGCNSGYCCCLVVTSISDTRFNSWKKPMRLISRMNWFVLQSDIFLVEDPERTQGREQTEGSMCWTKEKMAKSVG
jgi:hypothetical protein